MSRQKFFAIVLLTSSTFGLGQQGNFSRIADLVSAAQQSQEAGDYAGAARAYKQAVSIQPGVPELWANLGLMEQETGDLDAAIQSFQHAIRLNSSLYVPNLFLGIDLVRTGKAREALPLLLKAEHAKAGDPQAALALGRAYLSLEKFAEARTALEKAVRLDPKLGSAWFALGIAYLDSVEVAGRGLTEKPDSAYAQALYAESLEEQFRYREASEILAKIAAADAEPPCLQSELGYALARQHNRSSALSAFDQEQTSHPECSLAFLGRARLAVEAADDAGAIKLLEELWQRDHGYLRVNEALLTDGLAAERMAGFVEAVRARENTIDAELASLLETGQGAASGGGAVETGRGAVAQQGASAEDDYAAGHFGACAERLKGHLSEEPAATLRLSVRCAFLTGDYETAARGAAALESKEPHAESTLYWLIKADERLAFQALARFEQLEPNSARSHILLGDVYRQRQRYDDAVTEYKKALAIAPNDTAALLGVGAAQLGNNDVEAALVTIRSALAGSPDDPQINFLMAKALMINRQYAEAKPYLERSLSGKPQTIPYVHALLGRVYEETGDQTKAIAELKLGESSDVDGSVYYQLARIYRQQGNKQAAEEAFAKTKEIQERRRDQKLIAVDDPDDPVSPTAP